LNPYNLTEIIRQRKNPKTTEMFLNILEKISQEFSRVPNFWGSMKNS
jgi:hypothetical protein